MFGKHKQDLKTGKVGVCLIKQLVSEFWGHNSKGSFSSESAFLLINVFSAWHYAMFYVLFG